MKRNIAILLTVCLLLSGCSAWQDGSYHSVKPHQNQVNQGQSGNAAVSSYTALHRTLLDMVHSGKKSGIISVANYNQLVVARDMALVVQEVMQKDPIGAYAVEDIRFELGTNSGEPAIALEITYLHDYADIKKMQTVDTMEDAKEAITKALNSCESGIVLYIQQYEQTDMVQWVDDYGDAYAEMLMEQPQVTENLYPEEGSSRIMVLKFSYQNSRETLREMQTQVGKAVDTAVKAARQEPDPALRFGALYDHLMGLFEEFQQETSMTPAYSLLIHGVGDCHAFATVYGAFCRRTGLECMVVTGTRNGEPWSWNIVKSGEMYYHLDLPASRAAGEFRLLADADMSGYVWDYALYPPCGVEIPTEE